MNKKAFQILPTVLIKSANKAKTLFTLGGNLAESVLPAATKATKAVKRVPKVKPTYSMTGDLNPIVQGRKASRTFKSPINPTTSSQIPANQPGAFGQFMNSTAGKITTPAVAAAGAFGIGRSTGYSSGMEQGRLTEQQLSAIEAARMRNQYRDMYNNQGFFDRLMGNNPFD